MVNIGDTVKNDNKEMIIADNKEYLQGKQYWKKHLILRGYC